MNPKSKMKEQLVGCSTNRLVDDKASRLPLKASCSAQQRTKWGRSL